MRAERELAAATRTGKLKEYLLQLKQPFCEHPTLLWIENVSADSRSVWQCTECGATIQRGTRQPYACEQAQEASKIPPPGPQKKNLERRRARR
jgi:ribosomal protein L37AE/L43A